MTKGHVLLLGLALLGLGGILPQVLQWAGFGELNAGLASTALLVLVVILWVASYGWRVVRGDMTFMQMRRQYRQRYDQATDEELLRRFESLSETERQELLSSTNSEPGAASARPAAE
ncbi:DUF3007 family protein [Candidatus Synechococcus spongiarum]|uniref:DUF3007 domain-containing protein n=1 Tax=Candidatus Synechococcus spongiarum LMB bulk15N TaxID=1943583 RepID=A0A1T1D665_9SYNE|nr:DUF3007 family protein [Candidatus Synechococcus spongiarum]OOV36300.1 hypothetical protein BV53_01235 [Candidatus Synechococcus spongiarum LMB bulk15N]